MKKQIKKQVKHDTYSDILHACLKLHVEYPEWRFGQVIANAVREYDGRVNCDPFHIQDDEMMARLENLLDEFKQLDNYEE
jgi:hypothetical protein